MKIISWNIACLPKIFNKFSDPKIRKENILNFLIDKDPDIICIQEIFQRSIRNFLKRELEKYGYNIKTSHELSSYFNIGFTGGLMIASKDAIIEYEYIKFRDTLGEDYFANKGCLYIKTKSDERIFNIHLQAKPEIKFCWERKTLQEIQKKQIKQLINFIKEKTSNIGSRKLDINNKNIYIMGDLNIKPKSEIIEYLRDNILEETKYEITNLSNNDPTTIWKIKLDWIFGIIKIFEKTKYSVYKNNKDSDHFPIQINIDKIKKR